MQNRESKLKQHTSGNYDLSIATFPSLNRSQFEK